jgi:hypothetical protein
MGKLFWLIGVICSVWVIYEVWWKNRRLNDTGKLLWTLGAVLGSIITAILYFFIEKNRPE